MEEGRARRRHQEAERTVDDGKQWDDGPTYIEEEPWPGDLSATWPSYQPGV
jgi:hypothetical protein